MLCLVAVSRVPLPQIACGRGWRKLRPRVALSVGLAFLTGFYLLFTGRRLPPRPEDRPDAEIAEGTGELGFFSPHSWWPLITGMSAAVAALGAAIGWWLFLIGMLFVLLSAIGFVFEYYRGQYAH